MASKHPSAISTQLLDLLVQKLTVNDVPSDADYWSRYPSFNFNPNANWKTEFRRLAMSRQWAVGSKRFKKELRACYSHEMQNAGTEMSDSESDSESCSTGASSESGYISDRLSHLQGLCDDVGIEPADSVRQCKLRLQQINVSLVDLVEAQARGGLPRMFGSYKDLFVYIRENPAKRMRLDKAKRLGLQVFLKDMF